MIRRLVAVARNTHIESVRQKLFVALLFFGFLLMASALILKDISVYQDAKILADIGLASIEFFGTLVAVFIGSDLISRDIERKTVHLLLVKPLSRAEFVVGRYLGLAATLLTCVVAMTTGLSVALWTIHSTFTRGMAMALAAMALQLLLSGGIATCLSALASRSLATIGSTILVLLGRMSDVLKNAPEAIEGFPAWLAKLLYYAVPNLQNFDLKSRAVYGDDLPLWILLDLAFYAAAFTTALLAIAAAVFEKRDLK